MSSLENSLNQLHAATDSLQAAVIPDFVPVVPSTAAKAAAATAPSADKDSNEKPKEAWAEKDEAKTDVEAQLSQLSVSGGKNDSDCHLAVEKQVEHALQASYFTSLSELKNVLAKKLCYLALLKV